MNKLEKIGFNKAGFWFVDKRNIYEYLENFNVNFELDDEYKDKRLIYAFVSNKEIKYIGICLSEKTTLNKRMKRYRSRVGAGTNKAIMIKIKKELETLNGVEIFVTEAKTELKVMYSINNKIQDESQIYSEINIDYERALITLFNPEWNKK